MKLRDKLDRIRKLYPKGPTPQGQIYSGKLTRGSFRKVTLYTLFKSDENTHLLRPHIFESGKRARSAAQWSDFFSTNLKDIHINAVLPGIGIRTDKSWTVARILGWSAGDAQRWVDHPRMAGKRHKTKSSGRKNGQVHLRRRHGNRKRKAK
jgi:hypothetical protein